MYQEPWLGLAKRFALLRARSRLRVSSRVIDRDAINVERPHDNALALVQALDDLQEVWRRARVMIARCSNPLEPTT